ncbi:MAG: RecX family transcriptional regulator [Pseudomonadota bacterium]
MTADPPDAAGHGRRKRRAPRPLDATRLRDMALRYVARYATTRHKLDRYLRRKVAERGWSGDTAADVDALIEYCVAQGFVDDALYAENKAASLSRRGYGRRRIDASLHEAGISAEDAAAVHEDGEVRRWSSALMLAKRRRIGPFAPEAANAGEVRQSEADIEARHRQRQKQIQIMARAGHDFTIAATLVDARSLEQLRAVGDEQLDIALDALLPPQ